MTPQEIAARLPELTGGPHNDDTIIALARISAEAIRALNHATLPAGGLSEPATAYTALGQLAAVAHRLPQLCGQLARWLAGENTAGRLAHTTGGLDDALDDVQASLDRAVQHATRLGEALDQAHQATAWLYRPGDGGEDR
jgi:hypothetical protein